MRTRLEARSGTRTRRVAAALAGVATGVFLGGCATGVVGTGSAPPRVDEPVTPGEASVACTFDRRVLGEISGLASSIRHPGVLWAHNDSGDAPRLYAIRASDCAIVARVTLSGAETIDPEAIAVGRNRDGDPVIWLADIGDNQSRRETVALYRVPEPPELRDSSATASRFRVRYPDGPHNSEAILVEPTPGGRIWMLTKRQSADGQAYELRLDEATRSATSRSAFAVPALTTDAAYAPDGRHFALRTYFSADVRTAPPPGTATIQVAAPLQRQSEAITFDADSRTLYFASEGSGDLWQLPLYD